jgi:hypothetical protein
LNERSFFNYRGGTMGVFTFIPEWVTQDIIILIAGIALGAYILKKEERPGRILLEFLSFCFLYAAVYENFATLMKWYGYGRSILMIGNVPLSVPIVEYMVVYAAIRFADSMKMPGWTKPIFVGFNAMLFDFSLDPISVKLVKDTLEGRIGRWTWFPAAGDVQIMGEPIYNFTGWVLLAGWAAVFILLGRAWWERSGKKRSVAIAYPILGMLAALLCLISPLSQFLLWLGPFFKKGSASEWIMLGFHFALPIILLAAAWRGRMRRRLSLIADWPIFLYLGGFHLLDIGMCLISKNFGVLPIVLGASAIQWALIGLMYARGKTMRAVAD